MKTKSYSILFSILLSFAITSCGGSGAGGESSWVDSSGNYEEISPPEGNSATQPPAPPVPRDEQGPDPFGTINEYFNVDLIAANGAGISHVCPLPWNMLMPDGHNFDYEQLARFDAWVRSNHDNGVEVFMRLRSGGYSGTDGFTAIPNVEDWPIDTTDYSLPPHNGYKNGEWVGGVDKGKAYPPKVLTLDRPGNTSPWYNYVYALASRYNGTTPDPERPNAYLPKIDYWALDGEEEMTGRWYGTATDLYGGVGGDPDVGTLPSFYRAVHAANPDAKVVGGNLLDPSVLCYIIHEMMLERGGYDNELLQYTRDWLRQHKVLQFPFINVAALRHKMESPEHTRFRGFVEHLLAANKYYDILGYHMYSTYEYLPDIIQFYRDKMAEYGFEKPLWGSETGIIESPIPNPGHEIQAHRLIKLFTISLAEGVQHVTYSGMVYDPVNFLYTNGLYRPDIMYLRGNTTPEQANRLFGYVARESFAFFAHTIKGRGYQFHRMITRGDAELYVFRSSSTNSMFCVAWSDAEEASFDPRPELGIPYSAELDLYDYRGHLLEPMSEVDLSRAPVFLEWYE